jgi:hypothetical protein
MGRILDRLQADRYAYHEGYITLVQITRSDLYLSFCNDVYDHVTLPSTRLSDASRMT